VDIQLTLDFKLENILLHNRNSFPRLLIGDFGYSTTLESMIDQVPNVGVSYKPFQGAGTIVNLPPERLKTFSRPFKTGGLGESFHGQKRRAEIGGKWFEEEMQLDIWGLGGKSLGLERY
jgi:serine/threonine protein kinase